MLDISESGGVSRLPVKIVPGASRTRILGEWQGRARIAVAAAPEKGKANQALIEFLSGFLKINRRRIAVISGHASPLKIVSIGGITADALRSALQADGGA